MSSVRFMCTDKEVVSSIFAENALVSLLRGSTAETSCDGDIRTYFTNSKRVSVKNVRRVVALEKTRVKSYSTAN